MYLKTISPQAQGRSISGSARRVACEAVAKNCVKSLRVCLVDPVLRELSRLVNAEILAARDLVALCTEEVSPITPSG